MITFFRDVSKNKAVEVVLFNIPRRLRDGITFFDLFLNLDLFKADHKPSFEFKLTLLNIDIFSIHIYDKRHHD